MEEVASPSYEMPGFGDLSNLSPEKLQELETVLTSILALPVARETYAQIIDGTPTRTPYSNDIKAFRSHLMETIIVSDNSKPSDRAMQQYEEIRTAFAPQGLKMELKARTPSLITHLVKPNSAQLVQNYQNALPGSREHLLRLLEIVAASVNALAGMIYASFHPDTNIKPPEPPQGHYWQFRLTDHFYVDFYHTNYQRFKPFPFGLLNVVGYWAEAELFGGVVLFERAESGSEVHLIYLSSGKTYANEHQIINAFLHPQTTADAFHLSENQLKCFANLGRAGDVAKIAGAETVLPFAKEPDARIEPTFVRAGEAPLRIYKNEYDKPPVSHLPAYEEKCVKTGDEGLGVLFDEAMRIVKEKGWDQYSRTNPALFELQPSVRDAYSARDEASSSKEGSPSATKKHP
ncbi:MAG: hypothetical protein ALECFALPRED_006476 [Alectoria fallacina]|uniref:Uncharacterized protein n=1 Tax=Alectoria fallacina TaxID=1903189 RepID=A0A8H3IVN3_9LECA|nr:MAG: hypothetical protein ALECFALPRED_006476 [Alectoria fallacina]